jgi:hypothetical protein
MEKPNRVATVGQLRAVLEGIPDDTPLTVNAADPDYPKEAVTEQVITSAGFGLVDWGDGYGLEPGNVFALNCDFYDFDPLSEELRRKPVRPAAGTAPATEPEAEL